MNKYGGWIIAGVVCLILIALAVTGVVNFGGTQTAPTSSSSQALVNVFATGKTMLTTSMHNIPLRMVA